VSLRFLAPSLFEFPKTTESANLQYACGFHNGRFPLSLGEIAGLSLVRVDASEALAIFVKHRDLKMFVLASAVFAEFGMFSCRFCFSHCFNISMVGGRAQVLIQSIL
jgi:hypothetical protein